MDIGISLGECWNALERISNSKVDCSYRPNVIGFPVGTILWEGIFKIVGK